ncbi:M20 peptidase aminoacylase family protein [Virgibacillus sp. AGTR]|uniref:M20 peptidase aminoacylase family protein n=1 Tax=unclassified Virgibacillus TaxID=2620237 RepID=UPI000EF50AB6|nr:MULTISPECIES: M20 peptidase aminoacylase family protein [unclassified Virgibacillus]MCC2249966.1 M20 peptidase aminoacylase family protein [Virgibacillus sp. AGTR]QRZ20013.1 M20 peptidase aminoacylase family protein [Virgibacillus sp. AGTR]
MKDLEKQVKDTFNYLHQHAEISWEEVETTKYIANILKENGCNVNTFVDHTGVVGEYGNFKDNLPIVAVRADIDALWQEVDGSFQANHSCGHDAHMAMVLGLLWKLQQSPELHKQIAIRFIFQPAEEKGAGALKMVEKGAVDNVEYLFGVHLRPQQECKMGNATPVIVHGATKMYSAEIRGHDAHGARPHLNINAIEVGAQIVNLLSKIHLDPRVPHSVKMTNFQAGGKSSNIIPGNASFSLDMRAQSNEIMDELDNKVLNIFEAIKNLYDVEIKLTSTEGIAAARTNEQATSIMREAIKKVLGTENVDPPLVTPGGDDFHFYTIKRPELKATMLGLGCDLSPGLHHPYMTFNKDALMNGVHILFEAIKEVYQH